MTTLNAALIVDKVPVLGLVGVPKKIDYFLLILQGKLFNRKK